MEAEVFDPPLAPTQPSHPHRWEHAPEGTTDAARSARVTWFADRFADLHAAVCTAVVGRSEVVRLALAALTAGGHLLIDDVPGVGKTSLARAIAAATGTSVHRIQGTPDLLPSDITGTPVWNASVREFEFRPGPVFANVVIVDEVNRMSPRTQSALLEVMEERQVTSDGTPRPVPSPFLVLATQNPVDPESTFELPEAQLDRFLLCVSMGYPEADHEVDVVLRHAQGRNRGTVAPVMDAGTVDEMVAVRRDVHVSRGIARYVVELCRSTRFEPDLRLGASPRASTALVTAAQAWAASEGRAFVTADDVKAMAPPVLTHRLALTGHAVQAGRSAGALLARLLDSVAVPRGR
jgi:MoxR-like ATPase